MLPHQSVHIGIDIIEAITQVEARHERAVVLALRGQVGGV